MMFLRAVSIAAALGLAGAALEAAERDLSVIYDAGPDTIDVSKYPETQRKAYRLFERTCSACHTLARPINAPYATRAQWERYTRRMHTRANAAGRGAPARDFGTIVDFLVYDSSVRKLKRPEAWKAEQAKLAQAHARLLRERADKRSADDRARTRPYYDPMQVKPSSEGR